MEGSNVTEVLTTTEGSNVTEVLTTTEGPTTTEGTTTISEGPNEGDNSNDASQDSGAASIVKGLGMYSFLMLSVIAVVVF